MVEYEKEFNVENVVSDFHSTGFCLVDKGLIR